MTASPLACRACGLERGQGVPVAVVSAPGEPVEAACADHLPGGVHEVEADLLAFRLEDGRQAIDRRLARLLPDAQLGVYAHLLRAPDGMAIGTLLLAAPDADVAELAAALYSLRQLGLVTAEPHGEGARYRAVTRSAKIAERLAALEPDAHATGRR